MEGRRPGRRQYTEPELVDALLVAAAGRSGLSRADYMRARAAHGLPSPMTFNYRFGSWDAALAAAGLAPTGRRQPKRQLRRRSHSEDELRAALLRAAAGRPSLSQNAYSAAREVDPSLPALSVFKRRRAWSAWCELVELDPGSAGRPRGV